MANVDVFGGRKSVFEIRYTGFGILTLNFIRDHQYILCANHFHASI